MMAATSQSKWASAWSMTAFEKVMMQISASFSRFV